MATDHSNLVLQQVEQQYYQKIFFTLEDSIMLDQEAKKNYLYIFCISYSGKI